MSEIISQIFSTDFSGPRKVIKFLGVKFSFYDYKKAFGSMNWSINKNTAQFAYSLLNNADDDDLFCMRTAQLTFIFSKGCLNLDYNFFRDYVVAFGFTSGVYEYFKLDKNSVLYKEHIGRVKNGEFLWKYVERYFYIAHTFISKDFSNGEIYINSSYVPEKKMVKSKYKIQHVPTISKRKYIKGIAVGDYIKGLTKIEQVAVIDKLLNYIFITYKAKDDPDKITGELCDCHLYNFIIGEDGQFHFVDFDLRATESLDKAYCIYFMLYKYDTGLYKKMLKRYKLKDRHKYYSSNFSIYKQPMKQDGKNIVTREHKRLCKKYFTNAGSEPEYKLTYVEVRT